MNRSKNYGITLIALVITVIIMLIIAGVAISAISTGGVPFGKIQNVAGEYDNASRNEADELNKIIDMLNGETNAGANEPELVDGMKAVVFNTDGTTKTPATNAEWYNYGNKQWANAETEDGSLWVWIPRFAYKITYYTDESKTTVKGTRDVEGYKNASGEIVTNTGTEAEDGLDTIGSEVKSSYGSIDVVFLNGQGNQYYKNIDGSLALVNAVDDGYIIHPAFKDGRGNYANGEWNKELTGFWMAKFQAGFQYGDASLGETKKDGKTVERSSVSFTQSEVYIPSVENGDSGDTWATARNYLDGTYGENYANTKISYPVFKGNNYAMNYMTIGECYSLSRALNETNNPYGLNTANSDTHLTKNSEWGAVAYLGYSQYGLDGENIHINNKELSNTVTSVYVVTGYAASDEDSGTSEVWYTEIGQTGSSNGNITGVYDMSGATLERTAGYIANENINIGKYANSFAVTGVSNDIDNESTIYSTMYTHDTTYDNTGITANDTARKSSSRNNYKQNYMKYGDAVYEISTSGEFSIARGWNSDCSYFPHLDSPFFSRGGNCWSNSGAGMFTFHRTLGGSGYNYGFRAIVCPL